MADDTSRLEALVARLIQDTLAQEGGLEDLLRAVREVEESFPARDGSGKGGGEPARVDAPPSGEGTLKGDVNVVVAPTMTAVATLLPPEVVVIPDKAVDAIRSASPELAEEIQAGSSHDAMLLLTVFLALMALLQAAMQAYQILHPQAPTPPQIVEIFNQTYNVVNQTNVVNPPPPHGAG
jgi:hypothetical protein